MNEKICLSTGWYSNGKPTNKKSAPKMYDSGWFRKWRAFHKTSMLFDATTLYESNCQYQVHPYLSQAFTAHALGTKTEYHTRHDWWSSFLFGAMYAYSNNMHLVYIEQDCLVKGLDKAVELAIESDKPMFYGYGEYSFQKGWAEHSFVFVKNTFVDIAISRILDCKLDREARPLPEKLFHSMFNDAFTPWPFGYGRKPVADWDSPILYKQQITPEELVKLGVA